KIQKLKAKVQNKACVEGCIVEAQLVEEATNFLTLLFRSQARSIRNKIPRYDDGAANFKSSSDIGLFQVPGHCMKPRGVHELPKEKYEAAFLYILTNMPEMDEFFQDVHEQWKSRSRPRHDQIRELWLKGWKNSRGQHDPNFFDWFKEE
uniref:DUF4218 domain-containing protein n=1 Tax=Setaria italica TaxID=4555 RepID=K3Y2Y9_SETIT